MSDQAGPLLKQAGTETKKRVPHKGDQGFVPKLDAVLARTLRGVDVGRAAGKKEEKGGKKNRRERDRLPPTEAGQEKAEQTEYQANEPAARMRQRERVAEENDRRQT